MEDNPADPTGLFDFVCNMFSTCSVVDVASISFFMRHYCRDRVLDSRVSIYSVRYVVNNSLACEHGILIFFISIKTCVSPLYTKLNQDMIV